MERKYYQYYTARDFALDEDFQQWVLNPDEQSIHYWNNWKDEHPEKKEIIRQAVALVRSVKFRTYSLTDDDKDILWDAINDKITREETEFSNELPSFRRKVFRYRFWKYAAAVVIGIVVALGIKQIIVSTHSVEPVYFTVQSPFSEIRKVYLPDSSEVVLNANSKLVYTGGKKGKRQVWLDGEAYFHVRHTPDSRGFIVHTYKDVSVSVLGTRFNVNSYGKAVSVTLEQGSVRLNIAGNDKNGETELYLKPGERVNYNQENGSYAKSHVDADLYTAWTTGKLVMNNYTMQDVEKFMERIYGKEMVIKDTQLLKKRVSGTMPIIYNMDTMLLQFQRVFNFKFDRTGDRIVIHSK